MPHALPRPLPAPANQNGPVPDWTRAGAYRPRGLVRAPTGDSARLTLFAMRRIALAGLADAHAAEAMLRHFGLGFRRPLILLRTVMLELSHGARRPVLLAPCCCGRMTRDEARLLFALRHAPLAERRARRHIAAMSRDDAADRVICAAAAYGWALRDLGRAL